MIGEGRKEHGVVQRRWSRWLVLLVVMLVAAAWGSDVRASVRFEGDWPDKSATVDLNVQGVSQKEALNAVAEKLGWSLVIKAPLRGTLDLLLRKQPADKVLGAILSDGDYVLKRDGDLVSVMVAKPSGSGGMDMVDESGDDSKEDEGGSSVGADAGDDTASREAGVSSSVSGGEENSSSKSSTVMPKRPVVRGSDRTVFGGRVVVKATEVVHDVVVMGGEAQVYGTVTGDLVVLGGKAIVHKGAVVWGDATAVGGLLDVKKGGRIMGQPGVVGGMLRRHDDIEVGDIRDDRGESREKKEGLHVGIGHRDLTNGNWGIGRIFKELGGFSARGAMLFLLGAVLLTMLPRRLDTLRTEMLLKPIASLGWGALGVLVFALLTVALSVTVIGIPVAVVVGLVGIVVATVGFVTALWVSGALIAKHKTDNSYAHLGVGVVVYSLLSVVPYVRVLVTLVTLLVGIGAVVSSRGAGLFAPSTKATS